MTSAGPVRSERLAEEVTPILTARTEGAPRVLSPLSGPELPVI